MSTPLPLLPLEHLHPALWRAHQLGRVRDPVQPSGYAALDAELPGGGWPRRAITELLLASPGWGEIRLVAPALARVAAGAGGSGGGNEAGRGILLLGPPADPCAQALAQLGLDLARCVVIRGPDLLWPLEQALRSGQVGALVAWAPASLKGEALRRLQLAAQSHDGPAFVVRPPAVAAQPSPAPLRLELLPAGADALAVRLLKRRGPVLEAPVRIALPPVLSATARQRAQAPRRVRAPAPAVHA